MRKPYSPAPVRTDQIIAKFSQAFHIDPRLIIEAFKPPEAHQAHEIVVAIGIHGQQHQLVHVAGFFFHPEGGDIDLTTNNAVDFRLFAGLLEFVGTQHPTAIGERHRLHTQCFRLLHQARNGDSAFKQGVVGVVMEVGEVAHKRLWRSFDLEGDVNVEPHEGDGVVGGVTGVIIGFCCLLVVAQGRVRKFRQRKAKEVNLLYCQATGKVKFVTKVIGPEPGLLI